MNPLSGIFPALVTPLTSEDAVDMEALDALVEFQIGAGVHGLHPCGTTGEAPLLSIDERKRVAERVVAAARERLPVIVQVGHLTTEATAELARHAAQTGADAISVNTPFYYRYTEAALADFFLGIAKCVPRDFPVYLYNIPQCTNNPISPDLLAHVMRAADNVVGLKHSQPDVGRLSAYLAATEGQARVFMGSDHLVLAGLSVGAVGAVSGNANVFPELFVDLYDAFVDGDLPRARELQEHITRLATWLGNGGNLALLKAALSRRNVGVPVGGVRAPLPGLDGKAEDYLNSALAHLSSLLQARAPKSVHDKPLS